MAAQDSNDVEVRLGVIEKRADRLEGSLDTLSGDHARLSAVVDLVRKQLDSIDSRLAAVPDRVGETEGRIANRLDKQDEALDHLEAEVGETKNAAEAAAALAGQALVAAKREWPSLAKAAVAVLGGILTGVVVYLLTHLL